ncbi:hypothetical protein CDAR_406421 [Caerostris darwini]|uniref:Uncharacterized protein n=1 Tax=Caerostris darwini TaxID=1538125 RepID=A0AAV4MN48_9ARAC|nr:hypothetical protein CDAR_406421 [Caerostris darwini]
MKKAVLIFVNDVATVRTFSAEIPPKNQISLKSKLEINKSLLIHDIGGRREADIRRMLLHPVICSICHWHHLKMLDILGKCREVRISSQRGNSLSAYTKICVSLQERLSLDRRFIKSMSPELRKSLASLTYFRECTLNF